MVRRTFLGTLACLTLLGATPTSQAREGKPATILKTAASSGKFTTLLNALVAADLYDTLAGDGPFTVFAPTDEAFAKLPAATREALLKPEGREQLRAILGYHVLAGNRTTADLGRQPNPVTVQGQPVKFRHQSHSAFVNDAKILTRDVACRNGTIHIIDSVLLPPTPEKADRTIVGVAAEAKTFQTLLAALTAAELKEVLQGDGPFTVFAPTDEAFGLLPKGTVAGLLKPENRKKLVSILKYHVTQGKISAKQAVAQESLVTLQGSTVMVTIRNGRLSVNESPVVATDVPASNGVIHVIGQVLIPKE